MCLRLFIVYVYCFGYCLLANASPPNISITEARSSYASQLEDRSFIAFSEFRENPIKWLDSIPENRLRDALLGTSFQINAQPEEYLVFQIGIWALNQLQDVQVEFFGMDREGRNGISSSRMTCFNTGGVDFHGMPFSKKISIAAENVQALWIGIDLSGIETGDYSGEVFIHADGKKQSVPVKLHIAGIPIPNHGDDEAWQLSRLRWLNSTLGMDEKVTKGYLPVEIKKNVVSILGRKLHIGDDGLPTGIYSYFGPSNQSLTTVAAPIVEKAFRFIVEKENGQIIQLKPGGVTIVSRTPSVVVWKAKSTSRECDLECNARMEFDGFVDYSLKLKANTSLKIKDIRLEVPFVPEKAEYMMGLGHEGGKRKPQWKWKWDTSKNQDMMWVGNVNGGLRIKWEAENYRGALCDVFYEYGKLALPPSWGNSGKGGAIIEDRINDVVLSTFSGSREMFPGEVLHYDFELLITPFKVIDRKIKFNDRYFQDLTISPELPDPGYNSSDANLKIGMGKQAGANIVNVHHDSDISPFINYPCMDQNIGDLMQLTERAHKEGLRLKLYYSTRFMTVHQPEFWAFNSLDNEIIYPGPGEDSLLNVKQLNPDNYLARFDESHAREWLLKNMKGRKYLPSNFETMEVGKFKGVSDVSVVTGPRTRLDNFYVGFFDWMVKNLGVDGFFLDETTLDRQTLRRSRKILDKYRNDGRLDLHSFNHLYKSWGLTSCLNMYMDLLPYLDFTWIGEGRNYDQMSPDTWLIEISGIPFGIPGQMLHGGGNPWRGMVYGMTKRAGWIPIGVHEPSSIWKFWDDYKISEKTMIGYWEKDSPVNCSDPMVKISVYKGTNELLLAIGNWSEKDRIASLSIDWKKLGLDPNVSTCLIPEIAGFQEQQQPVSLENLTIPGGKGYLVVIR